MNPWNARFGALALTAIAAMGNADDKMTPRSIVRTGADSSGKVDPNGDLGKSVGLKNLTAISYTIVMLGPDNKPVPIDPTKHVFKDGDKFKIAIEADTDVYICVFEQGPDGVPTALLPDEKDQGRVPLVNRGQKRILPDDKTWFEVRPPLGKEKLLVYASAEKRSNLTAKSAFNEKKHRDQGLSKIKTPKKAVTAIEPKQVAAANAGQSEFRLRGLDWQPEAKNEDGSVLAAAGSYDENVKPDLFVEIELKSGK